MLSSSWLCRAPAELRAVRCVSWSIFSCALPVLCAMPCTASFLQGRLQAVVPPVPSCWRWCHTLAKKRERSACPSSLCGSKYGPGRKSCPSPMARWMQGQLSTSAAPLPPALKCSRCTPTRSQACHVAEARGIEGVGVLHTLRKRALPRPQSSGMLDT